MPAAKNCPECEVSMKGLDPIGHSLSHWPSNLDANEPKYMGARLRRAALLGIPPSEADSAMLAIYERQLRELRKSIGPAEAPPEEVPE